MKHSTARVLSTRNSTTDKESSLEEAVANRKFRITNDFYYKDFGKQPDGYYDPSMVSIRNPEFAIRNYFEET